jgi:pimeloyl-ACP methyl ester carboxylesterase
MPKNECASSQLDHGREGRVDVVVGAGSQDMQLQPESTRRVSHFARFCLDLLGVIRVDEHGNAGRRGDQLVQQLQPLRYELHLHRGHAREVGHIAKLFLDGEPYGDLTRDDILDNITLSWLTNTGVSCARLYREYKGAFFNDFNISVPAAVSVFPEEVYQAPRSWAERAYPKLIHYNQLDKGGHFAAWEQPKLFSEEVRAGFRSLRKSS